MIRCFDCEENITDLFDKISDSVCGVYCYSCGAYVSKDGKSNLTRKQDLQQSADITQAIMDSDLKDYLDTELSPSEVATLKAENAELKLALENLAFCFNDLNKHAEIECSSDLDYPLTSLALESTYLQGGNFVKEYFVNQAKQQLKGDKDND